jgi:hypothetical protein
VSIIRVEEEAKQESSMQHPITLKGLQDAISQYIELFVTTAVRTSNTMYYLCLPVGYLTTVSGSTR